MLRGFQLKVILVVLASAVAVYLGVLNLLDRSTWGEVSDGIVWTEGSSGNVVAHRIRDPAGGGPRAGIETGDRLVELGGIEIRSLDDYVEVMEVLAGAVPHGMPATYLIRKTPGGDRSQHEVRLEIRSGLDRTDGLLVLVALLHLSIGLFVFLRKHQSTGALHFFLLCLVSFCLYLYRYSGRGDPFDLLIYWIGSVALLLLPPLFLHFCATFPEAQRWLDPRGKLGAAFYLPAVTLLAIHVAWFLGSLQPLGLARSPGIAHFFDKIHLSHLGIFFCLGAGLLIHSGRQARTPLHRRQMKWVSHGTLIALAPFLILYAGPYFLGFSIHPVMEMSILSLALLPLCFGYAIIRYRLMDVELIFRESAAYVLASWVLLVFYVGVVLLVGGTLFGLSPHSDFSVFAVSALVAAFLFAPVKNKIQQRLDRYYYPETYDYRQSFADFGRSLNSEISLPRLAERVCARIEQTFTVRPVAVFLRSPDRPGQFFLYHALGVDGRLDKDSPILVPAPAWGHGDGRAERLAPGFGGGEEETRHQTRLSALGIRYLQPLETHGRVIGLVGLGDRANGDVLNGEDLELLAALAGYVATAMDNAVLYRSLETKAGELQRLKSYNESVIRSITAGVVVVDSGGAVRVWNSFMESFYGLEASHAVGRSIDDVFPPDLLQSVKDALSGSRWRIPEVTRLDKTRLKSSSGEDRLVNIHLSPFVAQDDVLTGTLLLFDDVTEKAQLEDQLVQAEKLTSIGLLAAGVAHEVNTPLAGISSYTQLLLDSTPASDSRRDLLEKIEKQSFRASRIVNNLVNFARLRDGEFREVNLNSLMLETVSLLKHQLWSQGVEVSLHLDPALPRTRGHEGKLQQVFVNLLMNAKDAMPDGGSITVRTSRRNSGLVVEVEDSGKGIPGDVLHRIYDPFFTTKDVGKGTGLGLSVCYGIVQEHEGRIQARSRVGEGSTFTVQLPVKRVQ
jgi:PAS domain S-box-containing protein